MKTKILGHLMDVSGRAIVPAGCHRGHIISKIDQIPTMHLLHAIPGHVCHLPIDKSDLSFGIKDVHTLVSRIYNPAKLLLTLL